MPEAKMTPGNVAYVAYGQQVDFKAFNGDPMPYWLLLPPAIKLAWERAAQAAIEWNNVGITTLSKGEGLR